MVEFTKKPKKKKYTKLLHCFDILLRLFQDSIKNRKNQNFINTNCHLENTLEIWPVCDRLECCARRSCAPISKSPEEATHCWCKPASISQQHCAPLEKKAFSSWLPVVDSHKYQERQILLGSFWNQTLSLQLSAKKKKKVCDLFSAEWATDLVWLSAAWVWLASNI